MEKVEKVIEVFKKVIIGGDEKKKVKKEKKVVFVVDVSVGFFEMNFFLFFIQECIDLFDCLYKEQQEEIVSRFCEDIIIIMLDGIIKVGKLYEIIFVEIVKGIFNSFFKCIVVVRIDGEILWDFECFFEKSCKFEFLDFNDDQGKFVFWYFSVYIFGEVCEWRFGCLLCIGFLVDNGFYYEMVLLDGVVVQFIDWVLFENIVSKVVKEKQFFQRFEMSKEDLFKMFVYNKYKQYIIKDKIEDGIKIIVYRNGFLIDLCRGFYVFDIGRIEVFVIMKNLFFYFFGDVNNDFFQRIYGVFFFDKK